MYFFFFIEALIIVFDFIIKDGLIIKVGDIIILSVISIFGKFFLKLSWFRVGKDIRLLDIV